LQAVGLRPGALDRHARPLPRDEGRALLDEPQALQPVRALSTAAGRTILFFPEGAFGPTNNCVGIGDVLRRRGHRVVFVVEESFTGTLEAKGFEERLMRLAPAPAEPEEPGQFWRTTCAPSRRSPQAVSPGSGSCLATRSR